MSWSFSFSADTVSAAKIKTTELQSDPRMTEHCPPQVFTAIDNGLDAIQDIDGRPIVVTSWGHSSAPGSEATSNCLIDIHHAPGIKE